MIATLGAIDKAAWCVASSEEGWPVGFAAWHIASGHALIAALIAVLAEGQHPPPLTRAMLDVLNAENLARQAECKKEQALTLLNEYGRAAAGLFTELSENQLARTAALELFAGAQLSVRQLIELALTGHARQHPGCARSVGRWLTRVLTHRRVELAGPRTASSHSRCGAHSRRSPGWRRQRGETARVVRIGDVAWLPPDACR